MNLVAADVSPRQTPPKEISADSRRRLRRSWPQRPVLDRGVLLTSAATLQTSSPACKTKLNLARQDLPPHGQTNPPPAWSQQMRACPRRETGLNQAGEPNPSVKNQLGVIGRWCPPLTYALAVFAHTMKTRPQTIALAMSCFLAGFFTCFCLMRQSRPQPAPAPTIAASLPASLAILALPTVATQKFWIDDGVWYRWPDGTLQRTPPPETQPNRYDLIDLQAQPIVDLTDPK